MNGAGNDFLILNNMDSALPETAFPSIAKTLCERHLSIGADGLMVVAQPLADGDFRMLFYNADGSAGEMCGNGARCICRYGYETGLTGETQKIETPAGMVTGIRIDRSQYRIRLNEPSVFRLSHPASRPDLPQAGSYVELGCPGLPHAVIPISDLANAPAHELFQLGRALRYDAAYPKGANIDFFEVIGNDHVLVRTYERGVEDFTYACGTGAGSTVAVLTMQGLVSGQNVRVSMAGGDLYVTVDHDGNHIRNLWLTGPTNIVCVGEITDENLIF